MFKKILFSIIVLTLLLPLFQNITPALADAPDANWDAVDNLIYFSIDADMHEYRNPVDVTITWINIALSFTGIIFLIMIIFSGFQWMTSGGNEEVITKARKRLINSIIGVALILCAYIISNVIVMSIQGNIDQAANGWNIFW